MNNITDSIYYAGVNDHQVDLFEGQYKVPNGMSYNSYVIMDEKIVVMDTVDKHFTDKWLANIAGIIGDRKPDYLVVQHMEPDHSASIEAFLKVYPDTVIVATDKALKMIPQFFRDMELKDDKKLAAANMSILPLGKHCLTFVHAPMVHWPEVMMSYESEDKVLFSADGFGKFGALDIDEPWDDEARRYYIGIVGKYGMQVQAVLKKASALDIRIICSLHGPVLKEDLSHYIGLYDTWSSYRPEKKGTVIAYTSVYGNTKKAALMLKDKLSAKGEDVKVYDLARCDMAEAVADAFAYDKTVLATTTYNNEIYPFMHYFIINLCERNFQKRTVGVIENGSWAPTAGKKIWAMLENLKELNRLDTVTIVSSVSSENEAQLDALADKLCAEV